MLNDEEIRVVKFIVGQLSDTLGLKATSRENVARFDLIFAIDDLDYPTAVEYANSYCAFCDDSKVKSCRENAYELVHLEGTLKKLSNIVSEATDKEYIETVRRNMQGVYFYNFVTDEDGNTKKIYADGFGNVLSNDEVNKRRFRAEICTSDENDIRAYYRLFSSPILWLMWTREEMIKNASFLVSTFAGFMQMLKLLVDVDIEFPFGQIVNDGNAIVIGLKCDFETNDIEIGIAEKGGRTYYISAKNKDSIRLIGQKKYEEYSFSDEQVEHFTDLGISLSDEEIAFIKNKEKEFRLYDTEPIAKEGHFKNDKMDVDVDNLKKHHYHSSPTEAASSVPEPSEDNGSSNSFVEPDENEEIVSDESDESVIPLGSSSWDNGFEYGQEEYDNEDYDDSNLDNEGHNQAFHLPGIDSEEPIEDPDDDD